MRPRNGASEQTRSQFLSYPLFYKTFFDPSIPHRKDETHPPVGHLYYCTHQLLCSHFTAEKLRFREVTSPRSHNSFFYPWYYHSVLVIHTGSKSIDNQYPTLNTLPSLLWDPQKNSCSQEPQSIQN